MIFDGGVFWFEFLKVNLGRLRRFWMKWVLDSNSGGCLEWFGMIENVGLCLVHD